MSKQIHYSLKAACSHCGRFGTVDDTTMVCVHCGEHHEPTPEELRQRNADLALWSTFQRPKRWRKR